MRVRFTPRSVFEMQSQHCLPSALLGVRPVGEPHEQQAPQPCGGLVRVELDEPLEPKLRLVRNRRPTSVVANVGINRVFIVANPHVGLAARCHQLVGMPATLYQRRQHLADDVSTRASLDAALLDNTSDLTTKGLRSVGPQQRKAVPCSK